MKEIKKMLEKITNRVINAIPLLLVGGTILLIFSSFGNLTYSKGYRDGENAAWELSKETNCKMDYSWKSENEVPVRCLKYFR